MAAVTRSIGAGSASVAFPAGAKPWSEVETLIFKFPALFNTPGTVVVVTRGPNGAQITSSPKDEVAEKAVFDYLTSRATEEFLRIHEEELLQIEKKLEGND